MNVSSVSPGAVGDDGRKAVGVGVVDDVDRLGQAPDLVELDEDRVRDPLARRLA